jgi:amino acid adenylation domain-containing protein
MMISKDEQTLIARFAARAAEQPDRTALRCGDTILSYAELERRSLALAKVLRIHGAGRDVPVAICLERSPELIVAMLAVLRTGSAYVPIDPAYPLERRRFMLADCGAPVVITTAAYRSQLITEAVVISPDETLPIQNDGEPPQADDLAYIIYTSGSTGKPKGVLCHHRGALNMLDDAQRRRALGPGDRCSWWTSPCFDGSVLEIFSALISGAELVIVPEAVRNDGAKLAQWFEEEKITSAYCPPMMVADLEMRVRNHPGKSSLRRLVTGVEPIPERTLSHMARAVPELCIINGYGPTEAAVYCTCYCVDGSGDPHRSTPIGKPLAGVEIFLFNDNMEPVADGTVGEIYIGGVQVARGYLNAPRQTALHFLETPCGRLYRTGDLAVRLPDGNLMFAGRTDQQIKFLGYRVEPGEIESALCRVNGVREAVVTAREDIPGIRRLIGYYTVQQECEPSAEALRKALELELPSYMIPSLFIRLMKIPLTPNGKTDRNALPPPAPSDLERLRIAEFSPPVSSTEKAVAGLFEAVLKTVSAGLNDHFFLMGGHSLLATQLISRIRNGLRADVTLKDFYENPTVEKLAAWIDLRGGEDSVCEEIPLSAGRPFYPLTPSQRTMWMLHQSDRSGILSNIPGVVHLTGPLNIELMEAAFNAVIGRHDALRMVYTMENGDMVQRPLDRVYVPITVTDLSGLDAVGRDRRTAEIRRENGRRVFDLAAGPLIHAELVKLGENRFLLFMNTHHIASDGWGLSLFNSEFAKIYAALTEGHPSPLPPVERQYSDVAVWLDQRIRSGVLRPQLDYWKNKLAAPRPDLSFPPDRPRPAVSAHRGARHAFMLPPELTAELTALGRRENASLFMVLTAIWQTLLHRATGSADILTGTAIANRNHPQLEKIVGTLINALALRTDFSGTLRFSDLLDRVRRTALEAYAHQDIPFEKVMETVGDGTRHPVFRNSLILHNMPLPTKTFAGLTLTDDEIGNDTAKMDMLLYFIERNGQLEGQLEYDTELFTAATAEQTVADFLMLARQVVKDPDRLLSEYLHAGDEEAPSCFVIGEGSLCLRCTDVLRTRGIRVLGLISPDAVSRRWAKEKGVPWHHPDENFANILSTRPFDFLFSIVNSYILKPDVLALPRRCAINYHDAPLPRYAGVYSTAWALIHRERFHGVSWHVMADEVDAGDLLKQRSVEIFENDTSFILNARCYDAAIDALSELALELVEGREIRTPQDLRQRTYYPLHKRPAGGGLIDWNRPQAETDALRRALDFGNQPNDLGLPKVLLGGELYVLRSDGSMRTLDGDPCELHFPAIGDAGNWLVNEPEFPTLVKKLEALNTELAPHERFWVRRFETFQPLELPAGMDRELHSYMLTDLPLFLCFLARFCSQDQFTVGWKAETEAPEFSAGIVPLHVGLDAGELLIETLSRAEKELETCRKHKTFVRDLFQRFPLLRRPPDSSIVLGKKEVRCPARVWEYFRAFRRTADLSQPLFAQPVLTVRDRQELQKVQTRTPGFGEIRCIHQLVEAQAEKTPRAIAVEGADEQLTYAELNARADALAVRLQQLGVTPDMPVGLFVNRSPEMCVGILGILKAGGAYVPLDPDYPADRLDFIIGDTAMTRIVTVTELVKRIDAEGRVSVCLDQIKPGDARPLSSAENSNLAYIFYTSGSTGKPKGVMVEHRHVVNHCLASIQTYGIGANDRVLQFFSMNFDGSVEELFPAWASGGTVVLRSDELSSSIPEFEQFIARRKITVADLPTAYWHEWVRNLRTVPETLRAVIIGGEKVSAELCRVWLQKGGGAVRLFNTYGPTECTVVSTVHELTGAVTGEVPIGLPIAGTVLYVADARQQLVPVGLPGELLIGGEGVARGYLNRPDLTREKFIRNPWGEGMLYRTGDLVCRQADGCIGFMGRVDHQVKIRGFRIEPDEIAAVLEQHGDIAQAVVAARDDLSEQKELAVYYIPEPGLSPSVNDLRAFLAANLPDYMVPVAFMQLDEFPIAPGGKVDRKALPSPVKNSVRSRENYVAPATPQQKTMAEIWNAVLGMDEIGVHDNFFDLGGHSLLAIQLVERILSAGLSLTVAQLFQYPTIAQMAEIVGLRGDAEYKSLVCLKEGSPGRTPFFLLHSAPGDLLGYSNLVHNLPSDQPVYGFQSLGLVDPNNVHSTIPEMAAHYISILRKFLPDGPYLLGGWCYGGYVAMEMARQLKERGCEVKMLALIDAWVYSPCDRRMAFYRRRFQLMRVIGARMWFRIVTARIKTYLKNDTADAVKMLDGVQMNEGVLANREEVYRRNREAALKYNPRFYPGRVVLFRSDELAAWFLPDMTMEWAVLTEDQDIFLVPGGHRDMLREPSVKVLAARLHASIEKALKTMN